VRRFTQKLSHVDDSIIDVVNLLDPIGQCCGADLQNFSGRIRQWSFLTAFTSDQQAVRTCAGQLAVTPGPKLMSGLRAAMSRAVA
jgi:hypothetical protein